MSQKSHKLRLYWPCYGRASTFGSLPPNSSKGLVEQTTTRERVSCNRFNSKVRQLPQPPPQVSRPCPIRRGEISSRHPIPMFLPNCYIEPASSATSNIVM